MSFTDLPRGLRDYDPDSYERLEAVRQIFVELSEIYNVKLMEPSSIELLETLEAKGGEEIVNEIYAFKDKSGRDLGLRFDLTVGITRYVCKKRDLPLPAKLGAFASMWRYDEPQRGRYRWFYQWDLEVYGDKSVEAFAEVLSFTYRMLKGSGVDDPEILISDRRTVEEAAKEIAKEKYSVDLLRAIDKLGKKSEEEIILEYEDKGYDGELVRNILSISKSDESSEAVKKFIRPELIELRDLLKSMNIPVSISFRIVRGLDYYTDIVFEAFSKKASDIGALAGGGGYDSLPALFGRPELKALGVAGGIDRLLLATEVKPRHKPLVYVAYHPSLKRRALEVLESLRSYGIRSEISRKSKVSDQLSEAEKEGASLAILVFPKELSEGKVRVKFMATREEKEVSLSELASFVASSTKPSQS